MFIKVWQASSSLGSWISYDSNLDSDFAFLRGHNNLSFSTSPNRIRSFSTSNLHLKPVSRCSDLFSHQFDQFGFRSNSFHQIYAKRRHESIYDLTNDDAFCGDVGPGRLVCSVSKPQCHVFGLKPGSKYIFKVRARNSAGPGVWSDFVSIDTPPGLPGRLKDPIRLLAKSDCAIQAAWDPVISIRGSHIIEYRLECRYYYTKLDYLSNNDDIAKNLDSEFGESSNTDDNEEFRLVREIFCIY